MKDGFGIGVGFALQVELLSQIVVIIYFTIKNYGQVFKMHRLFAAGYIQDGKPVMVQLYPVFHEGGLLIGTPVKKVFG